MRFKVGDKVRVKDIPLVPWPGMVGTVLEARGDGFVYPYTVEFKTGHAVRKGIIKEHELEPVEAAVRESGQVFQFSIPSDYATPSFFPFLMELAKTYKVTIRMPEKNVYTVEVVK